MTKELTVWNVGQIWYDMSTHHPSDALTYRLEKSFSNKDGADHYCEMLTNEHQYNLDNNMYGKCCSDEMYEEREYVVNETKMVIYDSVYDIGSDEAL